MNECWRGAFIKKGSNYYNLKKHIDKCNFSYSFSGGAIKISWLPPWLFSSASASTPIRDPSPFPFSPGCGAGGRGRSLRRRSDISNTFFVLFWHQFKNSLLYPNFFVKPNSIWLGGRSLFLDTLPWKFSQDFPFWVFKGFLLWSLGRRLMALYLFSCKSPHFVQNGQIFRKKSRNDCSCK